MADTRGILHPQLGFEHFRLRRHEPPAVLAPYVDRLWCVSWDLQENEVFEQPVLAHPCVNVVVELHRAAVYGVPSRLSRQRLTGRGWAVGAMFRAGGVRPFLPGSARDWVDQVVRLRDFSGDAGGALVDSMRSVPDEPDGAEARRVGLLGDFLAELAPAAVPAGTDDAVGAAALIETDRELCAVEALSSRAGIEIRSLQRLFAEHVGLSPKRVIRRYRLLEAAEAAAGGAPVSWADVARRLGFSDQAHLTRDFTAAFGLPPARYAGR